MAPLLSVVITSMNRSSLLRECLRSLEAQTVQDCFEVIVVDSSNDSTRELVHEQFPRVRLVPIPYPASPALMRARGVAEARGEIVAFTEDHCVPSHDWIARIIANHGPGVVAAGGAVENASADRAAFWAIYFCEYYKFMAPIPAGPVRDIPGSNASYKRSALLGVVAKETGVWDTLTNAQLSGNGNAGLMVSDPSRVIYHDLEKPPLRFFAQRFNYSRCFAALRVRQATMPRRLFYLVFSPALPAVVLCRMFRDVWRKGRNRGKLVRSLPFLVPFLVGAAMGEFAGYLLGVGDSWKKMD